MKTLTGRQVFSVIVDPTPRQSKPKAGSKGSPRAYHVARHDGKGFIVPVEFVAALAKGDVAELYLTESTYQREDPLKVGTFIATPAWTYGGFASKTQIRADVQFEKELQVITDGGFAGLTLSDAPSVQIAELQKASAL